MSVNEIMEISQFSSVKRIQNLILLYQYNSLILSLVNDDSLDWQKVPDEIYDIKEEKFDIRRSRKIPAADTTGWC